jgi:hypothetical protein
MNDCCALGVNNPSRGPEANKLAFELLLESANTGITERDETHVAEGVVYNGGASRDTAQEA